MVKIILSHILLISVLFCIIEAVKSDSYQRSRTKAYIKSECQTTLYPRLCIDSLSNYATSSALSPQQVAQAALLVSLVKTKSTSNYIAKVAKDMKQNKAKEYQAVSDCLCQMNNSVDQLSESVNELRRINIDGEGSFLWHSSNLKTWLSTVVTNADMCLNGFSGNAMGGKVKATIKVKVLNVAQVCSNALALLNRFVARHRAHGDTSKP